MGKESSTAMLRKRANIISENGYCVLNLRSKVFFEEVAKEDTYFAIHSNTEEATISVCNDTGIVGLPFVWEKDSGIDYNSFLVDTALLFCFIAGRAEDKKIEKKITDFVKEKIWKGVR